jgi:ribonuclease VapC
MVLDTSALLAILLAEAEAEGFALAIERDAVRLLGAPTHLETSIVVLAKRGREGLLRYDLLLAEAAISIVPFGVAEVREARSAYERFGKGRHPAALDLGDCAAYAVATTRGEPLLFKGGDFRLTDVAIAT